MRIKKGLPSLNIQILHGQESSSNIERHMEDFINKSYLTPEEIEMIETYRDLDEEHARIVRSVVRGFRLGDDRKLS